MKAIVLSFDKNTIFCELLYKAYMENWPDCPLEFRIPWNNKKPKFFMDKSNVELINCKKPVRATMAALLDAIPDDEWVYWCIDDRYPDKFLNIESLSSLYDYLIKKPDLHYNAIKVINWGEERDKSKNTIKIMDREYYFQKNNTCSLGFFHHYFCKSGFLKNVFLNNGLEHDYKIPPPEYHLLKWIRKQKLENILVPYRGLLNFGETVNRHKLMKNCVKDLKKYNCQIPKYPIANYSKVFVSKVQKK